MPICVCSFVYIYVTVCLITPHCVLFSETWTAMPGQDEQLFTDWSVTWWWMGVCGVGDLQDAFLHEQPIPHLSPPELELTSPLLLGLPPLRLI